MVVQNYQNGQIIALASYPTFDNRWFESDLGGGKFEEIFPSVDENVDRIDPDESILVNRAIQGRYNLGSTFKPFTAFAALDTGLLAVNDYYVDEGSYRMESVEADRCNSGLVRCVYRNAHLQRHRTSVRDTARSTWRRPSRSSSDAFFYRIGELIMTTRNYEPVLQDEVRKFGFGADPGIELPFAFDGTVPDVDLKAEYAERGVISESEGSGYFTGDNVQLAIGQDCVGVPLQLAMGYSTIANKGNVLRPEIIKAVYQPGVPDADVQGYADLTEARLAREAERQRRTLSGSSRSPRSRGRRSTAAARG